MAGPNAFLAKPEAPRSLQLHLWWTLVLVLAALGGAGLAVAADRPGNPLQRPELTYRADTAAQPWIDHMAADLDSVQTAAADLATDGRNVLGSLQALDRDGANSSLAEGDQTAHAVMTLAAGLRATETSAHESIDRWRLGPQTVSLFDQIDTAIAASEDLASDWTALGTTGRFVISMLEGFDVHDQAVGRATAAGRDSRWADALAPLNGAAADALSIVSAARDQLAQTGSVETLDDLIARYRSYDATLVALYHYLANGGAQSGDQFTALKNAVTQAQAALPSDTGALVVVVGEGASPPIANSLLGMDKAHGVINDALEAVSDAKTGGQGTDQTPLATQAPTTAP